MNVHPLIVHFPVALLTVYALLELATRIPRLARKAYLFHVKAAFLIIGSAGSVAAYLSGDAIENLFSGDPAAARLVETHSHWAAATVAIFGVLALCYAIGWLEKELDSRGASARAVGPASRLRMAVLDTPLAPILALAGLACVTVTGALGGAIVYGPDVDPVVKAITSLVIR